MYIATLSRKTYYCVQVSLHAMTYIVCVYYYSAHNTIYYTHTHIDDNDTDVKIADFGMARFVDTLEPDEDPCGTPAYVAVSYMPYMPYIPY